MRWTSLLAAVVIVVLAQHAQAQVIFRPFFDPGVTAYDPVVSVVSSGVVMDVQATVTADRRYVTITSRSDLATVIGFQTFGFNTGAAQAGLGTNFVGQAQPQAANNPLNQQGMVKVGVD